jgi:hypothetical protein
VIATSCEVSRAEPSPGAPAPEQLAASTASAPRAAEQRSRAENRGRERAGHRTGAGCWRGDMERDIVHLGGHRARQAKPCGFEGGLAGRFGYVRTSAGCGPAEADSSDYNVATKPQHRNRTGKRRRADPEGSARQQAPLVGARFLT